MKLYGFKPAPNPRRVRMFLAEKGIEIPTEEVDILKRENRTPAFLAKNPLGSLPVLELDDGTCIAESVAICRYFEALKPNPPLLGKSSREQAEVEMWQRRVELGLFAPLGRVWAHGSPITAQFVSQIPAVAEHNRPVVESFLDWLDGELAKREFIAGPGFTIADITALCAIDHGTKWVGFEARPERRELSRWHEAVSNRPSAKA